MKQTSHYKFKQYEGADLFNPLTVEAQNIQDIDAGMYANKTAAVQSATEVKSGTVHAITRSVPGASVIKFVATSDWTAGDTCTVDGVQVTALLTTGETLPTGAWKINASVLAILNGTVLTVFVSAPTGEGGDIDATTLQGHGADYFMPKANGAVKSVGVSVLLNAASWAQSGDKYAQTVAVAGAQPGNNIVIAPSAQSWDKAIEFNVRATAQAQGTITFTADKVPDASLYMNVIVLG